MDGSIAELLVSGLKLMLVGMGIVFFFLLLLVGVIQQTAGIIKRLEVRSSIRGNTIPGTTDAGVPDDQELVAVIAAAIHCYERP